jgi:hypothetical protein
VHGFGKPGHRFLGLENNGVVIRGFDGFNGIGNVEQFGVFGVLHAFEGEFDVGGGKGIAVVKSDPLAQLEAPGQTIDPVPLDGQGRSQLALGRFALQKAVEKIGHVAQVGVRREGVGIHGLRRRIRGDDEVRHGERHSGQYQQNGCESYK